jgi:hypothetical protein
MIICSMTNGRDLGSRIYRAVRAVLPRSPEVAVHARPGMSATFDVSVHLGRSEHRFVVGWTAEGWPAAVSRLVELAPDLDVVLAPNLSEGARDWLAEHDLGWIDEVGRANVYLPSGLIIFREPPEQRPRKELPAKWTRATVTAAEAALAGITPTVEAIERATGLSRGSTANALDRLERLELLERPASQRGPNSARRIIDYSRLLDQYATAVKTLRARESTVLIHRLWRDALVDLTTSIAPSLDREAIDWGVTGTAASAILAPYLSNVTIVQLYVRDSLFEDPEGLAEILGGQVVKKGHRIEIRKAFSKLTTRGPVIDGVHLALPVRIYADLLAAGGRSGEAAYHLRENLNVGANTQPSGS